MWTLCPRVTPPLKPASRPSLTLRRAAKGERHHVPDVPGCHEGDLVLANTEEPTFAQLTVPAALEGDGNEGDGDVGRACGHHASMAITRAVRDLLPENVARFGLDPPSVVD